MAIINRICDMKTVSICKDFIRDQCSMMLINPHKPKTAVKMSAAKHRLHKCREHYNTQPEM